MLAHDLTITPKRFLIKLYRTFSINFVIARTWDIISLKMMFAVSSTLSNH